MPPNWEVSRAVIGELAERWDGRAACAPGNIFGFMYFMYFVFVYFRVFEVIKLVLVCSVVASPELIS